MNWFNTHQCRKCGMSFPIKQTMWKHILSEHKRTETLAHFNSLFKAIYNKDVYVFKLLSQLCKESIIALKPKITFDLSKLRDNEPKANSLLENDLKIWDMNRENKHINPGVQYHKSSCYKKKIKRMLKWKPRCFYSSMKE